MTELSLEDKSARYEEIEETFLAELNQSLGPRGSESLYDFVGELDLPADVVVLDAGCGKGRHTVELARRLGVRVIGIDPAPVHLDLAAAAVAAAESTTPGVSARIEFVPGRVEGLPLDDGSVDLVWCRDVLGAVENLDAAYREFARVLRPKGRVIVYQSGLAPDLTERESGRFWVPLDGAVTSADPARIEAAITASGLHLDRWLSVGLEWAEHHAEATGKGPSRLLHLARLLRQPERYIERFGQWEYDVMVADCYWHLWRMMRKLDERVYLLTKPG
jgi:SAM-dependent methyltransferase